MNIFDQRGEVLKSFISDAPRLLVGTREEKFKHERAIRMFQFQTWIFAPGEVAIKYAGLIAATKILRKIEEDVFLPEECTSEELPDITLEKICELRTKSSYWRSLYWDIYDKIIAAYGGLTALIDRPVTCLRQDCCGEIRRWAAVVGRRHFGFARSRATPSRRRSARCLHGRPTRARVDYPHAR